MPSVEMAVRFLAGRGGVKVGAVRLCNTLQRAPTQAPCKQR